MVPENKALPGFTGMALPDRYDPPTIVISDDDDLDLPDETINDVLDKVGHLEIVENSTRKNPRRDTDVFHKAIQVIDLIIELNEIKKKVKPNL